MTKSTITREWLQGRIANMECYGVVGDEALILQAYRMALAAMDSEPVDSNYRKLFTCTGCGAEGLDEPLETNCHCCVDGAHWVESRLYRHAQPAPVVLKDHQIRELVNQLRDIAIEYHGTQQLRERIARVLRAAMLQAEPVTTANKLGNSPVIPDGWKLVPIDATRSMIDAARRVEEDGYDAMHKAMLAAGPQLTGSDPATVPGKWIPVSERMPETDGNYWGWWSESKRQGPVWFIKSDLQAQFQSSEITHWMPLPAAPQEVRGE